MSIAFQEFYRFALDRKKFFPTGKYAQQLWVTVVESAPSIEKVEEALHLDIEKRKNDMLAYASDKNFVGECELYISLHQEMLEKIARLKEQEHARTE